MKKAISLCLVLALVCAALAGCASNQANTTQAPAQSADT